MTRGGGVLLPATAPVRWMERSTPTVAAVVPAYNEEKRIGGVIEAIKNSGVVDQLIVVSDGSTDGTYEAVRRDEGVEAFQLPQNLGKAGAMFMGALRARTDCLLFLDADLIGLTPGHVRHLVHPVLENQADMAVGTFHGGRFLTDLAQTIAPAITGQRVVSRDFFLSLPGISDVRYGVEMAIGFHARRQGLRISNVVLHGVTHPMKEEKLGLIKGSLSRLRMYYEMGRYVAITSLDSSQGTHPTAYPHNRRLSRFKSRDQYLIDD